KLVSTTLAGFFHLTQRVLAQMVTQKSGHIVSISTSLVATPIAGVPASLPILLKGGLEAATKALAIEYASQGVRVNAVAAGPIDTPMHPKENHPFLSALNPMNRMGTVQEMTEAVLYLSDANFVSGEVLHVDGGAHAGKW
ncbi:MAG: SDR family oxidoreductase, partial [Myxococcaceae bacterium]|nr:SDR family oxidoreductase [Myxococcaceae bacterium]